MRRWSVIVFLCGCNHQPLENIPVDMAVSDLTMASQSLDLAAPDLSLPPPRPCTLRPAGDPVHTVGYDDARSSWHCEGLLARGPKEVIHYGSVSLRFGVWDDPAIIATSLDVTSWPPVATRSATQFFYSMHSPASLFELAPGTLALTWSFDNDGNGPQGVLFETIDDGSWSPSSSVQLTPVMWGQGRPLALGGGQFAMTIMSNANQYLLAILDQTGKLLQSAPLGQSNIPALEKPHDDLFAVVPYGSCVDGGAATCSPSSMVVLRANLGSNALTLDEVARIPARNPAMTISAPQIISDHDRFHFLTWWEGDLTAGYLFAVPISPAGQVAGPVEVWFTTTHAAAPGQASIGAVGAVVPVVTWLSSDAGQVREIHLIQRQLTVDAPVTDLSFGALDSSFVVASQQLDDPRALLLGYNDYPQISGAAGYGVLRKYVCEED
jgi:hypothetical protein